MNNKFKETRTSLILKEQTQLIDEGIWDRTKAKAAGVGAFFGSKFGEKSKSYQTTAQTKLINDRLKKLSKIVSELENDISKSTGLTANEIKSKYPDIYGDIEKLKKAISLTRPGGPPPLPAPSPAPAPSRPTPSDIEKVKDEIEKKEERGLDTTNDREFLLALVKALRSGEGINITNTGGSVGDVSGGSVRDIDASSSSRAAAAANIGGRGDRASFSRDRSTRGRSWSKSADGTCRQRYDNTGRYRSKEECEGDATPPTPRRPSSPRSRTSRSRGGATAIAGESLINTFKTMKYISYNDQELLSESYNSINAKQIILESSVDSFVRNAPNVSTLAEAYAIIDIYNDLVEEGILGGLANVAKGVGGTIARGAQGVAQGAKAAGQAVVQGAKTAGQMVGAAGQQIGQNVSQMYQTGSKAAEAQKALQQARAAAEQLINLINQAKQLSPETFKDARGRELAQNISNLPLGKLVEYLGKTGTATQGAATAAQQQGVFGGVGQAVSNAYQGGAAAPAGGAPAAAPAAP